MNLPMLHLATLVALISVVLSCYLVSEQIHANQTTIQSLRQEFQNLKRFIQTNNLPSSTIISAMDLSSTHQYHHERNLIIKVKDAIGDGVKFLFVCDSFLFFTKSIV